MIINGESLGINPLNKNVCIKLYHFTNVAFIRATYLICIYTFQSKFHRQDYIVIAVKITLVKLLFYFS